MDKRATTSLALVASITALTLFGLIGGWLILLSDGFHHQPSRFSRESVFVGGLPALIMAAIFFLMAAIGIASLIQQKRAGRGWYALGCGCVLLPPVFFALLYW